MRKFEHLGNINKKFQKSLNKDFLLKKNGGKNIKANKPTQEVYNFGKRYDELFNKFAKEYPKYQDPISIPFDINSQDSIDLFQKNSQIKDEIIKRITVELRKGEVAPIIKEEVPKPEQKVDIVSRNEAPNIVNEIKKENTPKITKRNSEIPKEKNVTIKVIKENIQNSKPKKTFKPFTEEELKTATTSSLLAHGYDITGPEFKKANKRKIEEITNKIEQDSKKFVAALFKLGGPQPGETINVIDIKDNYKVNKYTIIENDGEKIIFTIGNSSTKNTTTLEKAKESLMQNGLKVEFGNTNNPNSTENKKLLAEKKVDFAIPDEKKKGVTEVKVQNEEKAVVVETEKEIPGVKTEIEVDNSEEKEKKTEKERIKNEKFDKELARLIANHFKLEKAYNDKLAKYEELKKKIEAKKAKENIPVAETENIETENEEIPTEQEAQKGEEVVKEKIANIEKRRQEELSLTIIDESKLNEMVDIRLGNDRIKEYQKKDQIRYTFENNLINGLANESLSQIIRETGKRNTITESMYWLTKMTEIVMTIEKGKELGLIDSDKYESLIKKFQNAKSILENEVDDYVKKINAKYDKELEDLKKING
ncbi:hypothetical protein IT400_04510 [Candidatus Nomurabacteria bacterium]|nr:hypothetical protein [Candidatus Nomurabacteria bacterium]